MKTLRAFMLLAVSSSIAIGIAGAQASAAPPPSRIDPESAARTTTLALGDTSASAVAVLDFERTMEAAVVRGDADSVSRMLADDFSMVHGDVWTTGGKPPLIDDKQSFLQRVRNKQYLSRTLDSVKVELHGDIAVTYGRYVAENSPGGTPRSWFSVWFERVYAKRNGTWLYLSHRTVHGPNFGPNADSVRDK